MQVNGFPLLHLTPLRNTIVYVLGVVQVPLLASHGRYLFVTGLYRNSVS